MNKYLIFFISILTLISCNKQKKVIKTQAVINIEDSTIIPKNKVYVKYKIPLPLDLFRYFLKDTEFDESYLLPTNISSRCITETHKALILGLANADLAFCIVTGHNQFSSIYFELSKNLAFELGIDVGYSENLYRRFNENINDIDSIQKIAEEAYWRTCNYLEDNNKYNILPFVIASGWYESVYLLVKSKNGEIYSDEVKNIIFQQEEGFRRVLKFLYDAQLQTSAGYYYRDIKKIIRNIQKILDIYKLYYAKVSEREKYYNLLISTISEERTNFINGKL